MSTTVKAKLFKTQVFSVYHPLTGCKPMKGNFPEIVGNSKPDVKKNPSPQKKAAQPVKKEEDDDDDDDLFGGDDDEDDAAAKEAAKKRAEAAKKGKEKKKVIEKSQCVFEVKPWESDTNLEELAQKIKQVKIEGLNWGEGHKLVPVAYGIKKLLIQCVIIDDMVLIEDITDAIEQFEDYVQSVDMASMNKL